MTEPKKKTNVKKIVSYSLMLVLSTSVAGCGVSHLTKGLSNNWFGNDAKKTTVANDGSSASGRLSTKLAHNGNDITAAIGDGQTANNCPKFAVQPQNKLVTKYEDGQAGNGLAVNYRGEITKTARECAVSDASIVVKYGVAGRLLLGPKGHSGAYQLPMLMHVADRAGNKLYTEKIQAQVTVPEGQMIGYFSLVKDVKVPVPQGYRAQDFRIFVGFENEPTKAS